MINFARSALKSVGSRLYAVAAAAAVALMAGLSAPATGPGASFPIAAAKAPPTHTAAVAWAAKPDPAKPTAAPAAAKTGAAAQPAAPQPAAPQAPAKKAPAQKAPTAAQLHPTGIGGEQQTFTPTAEQLKNARAIIQTGQKMGLPPRAWVIAVATALQESTLHNYGDLGANNDHDSLGLFQQRPSSGWGTPTQVQDPVYASKAFYQGLIAVPNWDNLALAEAAQTVQVSAYPDHYAKWEMEAGRLVSAVHGEGPYAKLAAGLK